MRKLYLTVLAACVGVVATNAQDFGAKVGANWANVDNVDIDAGGADPKYKFNFTLGVYAEFELSDKIGIQPEIVVSGQGYKLNFTNPGTNTVVKLRQKLGYIAIPVLVNVYLGGSFFIQAGPYLAILDKAKQSATTSSSIGSTFGFGVGDNKKDFKSTAYGAAFGLGVRGDKTSFTLRYRLGLSDINDIADSDTSIKNKTFNVSLGYRFIDN